MYRSLHGRERDGRIGVSDGLAGPPRLRHLAIIPDGNRRWSRQHGVTLESTYFASCRKMLDICALLLDPGQPMEELSLFFVSAENLRSRSRSELDSLFSAGDHFLDAFYSNASYNDVQLRWILHEPDAAVDSSRYSAFVARIRDLQGQRLTGTRRANVLLGYDVRRDIEDAIGDDCSFNYERLSVTRPVDLIVRSGRPRRLSGFLPLMCQYADFAFIDKLFPDVTMADVAACIEGFRAGDRHFGS